MGCTDDGVEDVISQERNSIYLQLNCKVEYHEDSESDTKLPIMENHFASAARAQARARPWVAGAIGSCSRRAPRAAAAIAAMSPRRALTEGFVSRRGQGLGCFATAPGAGGCWPDAATEEVVVRGC